MSGAHVMVRNEPDTRPAQARKARCRLFVISNIPNPYNDALFAAVAKQPDVDLLVAYCSATESNRSWKLPTNKGYAYRILRGIRFGTLGYLNPAAISVAHRFRPTVAIITGSYRAPSMQLVMWWLTLRGIPWYYWSEALQFNDHGRIRNLFRDLMRKSLYRARGILAIGTRAAATFERLGIRSERIRQFHYYADTSHFELPAAQRAAARAQVRSALEIAPDAPVVLFMGQLIHRKGVDLVLHAFARQAQPDARLVIVGEGAQADELKAMARELGVASRTQFVGFVQPAELPRYVAAADALVVPSRREGWGLVVPEAMAAGTVVIASDQVAAAVDLIRHGESGFTFPVDDVDALVRILRDVCGNKALRERVGEAAIAAVAPERTGVAADRMVRLVCPGCATEDE